MSGIRYTDSTKQSADTAEIRQTEHPAESKRINTTPEKKRPYPVFTKEDWGWSLAFLLSMALVGLQIFPMIFMALFIMINRMMNNRHEFIIQLTIFFGGYALTDADTMHFKADDIALVLSFIFYFIFRKPPVVIRTFHLYLTFLIGLLVLASFSEESFSVQLYSFRYYIYFIYFR